MGCTCGSRTRDRRHGGGFQDVNARGARNAYIGATIRRTFAMFMLRKKLEMPTATEALPGRPEPIPTAANHYVLKRPLKGPYPEGLETAIFGLGCFWGAERA